MAKEFYGFFDSTAEDERQYVADEMATAFRALGGTGVGRGLKVQPGEGMQVFIEPGIAMIDGYVYALAEDGGGPKALELAPAGSAGRIDRVVLRLNLTPEVRTITAHVLPGTPSAQPKPPAITREESIREISLCQVHVEAAAEALTPQSLQDERDDEAVCGVLANAYLQYGALDARYLTPATPQKDGALSAADKAYLDGLSSAITPLEPGKVSANIAYQESTLEEALLLAEENIDDLLFDEADATIHLYTHQYNPQTKVHSLSDGGAGYANGRVFWTEEFSPGDSFTVNGAPVEAFAGGFAVSRVSAGHWVGFVFDKGAAALDFLGMEAPPRPRAVVGDALPQEVIPSTIAVVTDYGPAQGAIPVFSQEAPPAPANGMVWIKCEPDYRRVVQNGNPVLKLRAAYVYRGSAWEIAETYYECLGAWVKSHEQLALYKNGSYDSTLVGNLMKIQGATGVITFGANGLVFSHHTPTTAWQVFYFGQKIDVTEFDKLTVKYSLTAMELGYVPLSMGLMHAVSGIDVAARPTEWVARVTNNSTAVKVSTLDVSELRGSYYVVVAGVAMTGSVTEIILE